MDTLFFDNWNQENINRWKVIRARGRTSFIARFFVGIFSVIFFGRLVWAFLQDDTGTQELILELMFLGVGDLLVAAVISVLLWSHTEKSFKQHLQKTNYSPKNEEQH